MATKKPSNATWVVRASIDASDVDHPLEVAAHRFEQVEIRGTRIPTA